MPIPRSLLPFVLVLVSAAPSLGQLTVDATGPIRNRTREATRSSGGGVGRKLPLQVAIKATISAPDENGRTLIEFILTNSGAKALTLPVSPHSADLEPSDPRVAYTVLTLGLRVFLGKKPGVIFPGGADLYGSVSVPATVVTLAPGDSIRVLTKVAMSGSESETFVATASLNNETLRTVKGELLLESQEIGFATSGEYTRLFEAVQR
jgi:hypothetical protein